jgi:hypothetical protein
MCSLRLAQACKARAMGAILKRYGTSGATVVPSQLFGGLLYKYFSAECGNWMRQSSMLRTLQVLCVFGVVLLNHIAVAQEASPAPDSPKVFKVTRFVPSGEGRTIAKITALNRDCSLLGPVVGRVIEKPAHGEVSFETGDFFPTYAQTNPLFECNSKRVSGLMINYRSEQDFLGQDNMNILLIFPDGTAAEWDYTLVVK